MRILIVEDTYLERKILKGLLQKYGDCELAPNADIGFEMFKIAHTESEKFQLITVDINMPGKNGLELIRDIRRHEDELKLGYDQRVKILMITISANFHDVSVSYNQGCEYYCLKPVDDKKLAAALKEVGLKK